MASTLYNAEGFYHIPKVNADLPGIDATNAKIYNDYYSYMQTYVYGPTNDGTKTGVEKISYIWGVKDSYLSILMSVVWGAEPMCEVYTVSLETGALVDNNEILSVYDMTSEDFNELVEQASQRLGDNIRWPVPYINPGNADLCAVGSSEEWGWSILANLTGTSEPVRPWDTKDVRTQVTEHAFVADEELLSFQPGYYVEEGNENNILTIHTVGDYSLTFSAFWYRLGDIFKATAAGIADVVSFDYSGQNMRASGSIRIDENIAVLTLTDCSNPYIATEDYHFKLIGRVLTDKQLAEISATLGVPENLNVEIKQGEPCYWEGGGFYRTEVEILHNGKLIAGASVDSMTGGLAGGILMFDDSTYTAQTERTGYVSESAGELNIRSGPGTEYPSIGRLQANEEVTIYETRNNASETWGRISNEGWVCLDYITFSDP